MSLAVVILAAGKGTRLKTTVPKPLVPFASGTLLAMSLRNAYSLSPNKIIVVVGHQSELVEDEATRCMKIFGHSSVNLVCLKQTEQKGTGHALMVALPELHNYKRALVLYADSPLLQVHTLTKLLQAKAKLVYLGAKIDNPTGYGRIVLKGKTIQSITEERDCNASMKKNKLVNSGVIIAEVPLLERYLKGIKPNKLNGEYYLTDLAALAKCAQLVIASDSEEILGVNSLDELHRQAKVYEHRIALEALRKGLFIADVNNTHIRSYSSQFVFGVNCTIDTGCVIIGKVILGDNVRIEPYCVLINVTIGSGSLIRSFSHLDGVTIGAGVTVGPYARLRPGTVLSDAARVGNFVEIKKSTIGAGSKVNHLSYIGDTTIGKNVNIGAGTITCNYDGKQKHTTTIGNDVFVGSGVELVAPVTLEDRVVIGAGTTVRRSVEPDTLVVGQPTQKTISKRNK
ncbi:MAG: bifunctional UDP-N-acetylglucosamine diphosphorylase/glucosamine-1-phosphate N-acetyltransferase GlmU [Methylacidiphilales bacterium]|nr:bifunctional UDP-N-acetylglucosamine diphosphorylase/glucosamine-1-phosphate N-acetyltransferase GlmU [Candidatus Methylacidiphilales bacterium]